MKLQQKNGILVSPCPRAGKMAEILSHACLGTGVLRGRELATELRTHKAAEPQVLCAF